MEFLNWSSKASKDQQLRQWSTSSNTISATDKLDFWLKIMISNLFYLL